MDVDRVAEVIRKAKAILPHIQNPANRKMAASIVVIMEDNLKVIREQNIPCPPDLEDRLESAFKVIEVLYNKTATN
jgi:hypothetical protein